MGNNIDGPEITLKASAALGVLGLAGTCQFHIMTLDTAGRVKIAADADLDVEPMLGVLQNEPEAIDQPAVVRIAGVAKVVFTGIIAPGVAVTTDGSGHAVACANYDWQLGITLETTTAGGLHPVLLTSGGQYFTPSTT